MASNMVVEAVTAAKQYLSNKFDKKDLATIMVEIKTIAGIKDDIDVKSRNERIGYTDLQKKLANLNEKEADRKEKDRQREADHHSGERLQPYRDSQGSEGGGQDDEDHRTFKEADDGEGNEGDAEASRYPIYLQAEGDLPLFE